MRCTVQLDPRLTVASWFPTAFFVSNFGFWKANSRVWDVLTTPNSSFEVGKEGVQVRHLLLDVRIQRKVEARARGPKGSTRANHMHQNSFKALRKRKRSRVTSYTNHTSYTQATPTCYTSQTRGTRVQRRPHRSHKLHTPH